MNNLYILKIDKNKNFINLVEKWDVYVVNFTANETPFLP